MAQFVTSKNDSGITILNIEGDLDYHASNDLRSELTRLMDAGTTEILVNLGKVSYIDSTGIAAFVEIAQKMKLAQGKLVFFNLPDGLKKVFQLAKLHLFFPIGNDQSEAESLLKS